MHPAYQSDLINAERIGDTSLLLRVLNDFRKHVAPRLWFLHVVPSLLNLLKYAQFLCCILAASTVACQAYDGCGVYEIVVIPQATRWKRGSQNASKAPL